MPTTRRRPVGRAGGQRRRRGRRSGPRAAMSGAPTLRRQRLRRRAASAWTPSRSRRARRRRRCVLPGETTSRLVPSASIWLRTWRLRALAEPDGEDHRGDADEDAEHRQRRAQPVDADRLEPGPAACPASSCRHRPRRRVRVERSRRRGCATTRRARRGHVGLVGDQHDRAAGCGAARRAGRARRRSRRESRLPVGSSARISAGSVDQRAGDRHPLLLAAGQLAGPVLDPVGEPDPVERRQRRARAARPRRPRRSIERQLDVAPGRAATAAG